MVDLVHPVIEVSPCRGRRCGREDNKEQSEGLGPEKSCVKRHGQPLSEASNLINWLSSTAHPRPTMMQLEC